MQKRYRVKGIHHSNAMTKKMLQVYPKIAWDIEIWIAEEATHLTHKNEDRFMGRNPEEYEINEKIPKMLSG